VGLHDIAMGAMRLPAMCTFSPALVTLSVGLAIVFSLLSLRLAFAFRDEVVHWRRIIASALLMGTAISAGHYTGMAAATFSHSATIPDLSQTVRVSTLGIIGIASVTVMVLVGALLTALVDRLQKQKALLDELLGRLLRLQDDEQSAQRGDQVLCLPRVGGGSLHGTASCWSHSGAPNEEVATALDISVKTVDAHRASIMRKLKLDTHSDLTQFAIRHQTLELGDTDPLALTAVCGDVRQIRWACPRHVLNGAPRAAGS
jgi:hypothetical protein